MSCLSNPKIKNALTKLISSDLHTRSVDGVKVDLEAYIREVYDFIKKSSNNDMTALTGARMVPTLINLITVHDPELAAELKKVSPTLRTDAMILSVSFEESIDNTINYLNLNPPALREGETAESLKRELDESEPIVKSEQIVESDKDMKFFLNEIDTTLIEKAMKSDNTSVRDEAANVFKTVIYKK